MRGLHNVFLWLILVAFSAIPASASSFTNFVGWGKGDENLEVAFYPVIDASPRYLADTNWHFAKDVWANDFLLAVWERAVYGDDEPAASLSDLYDVFGWEGVRVPFENERLHDLKMKVKDVATSYLNLNVRTNGTYDAWFNQWDYNASPYNGSNYTLYLLHVYPPPNWTFEDQVLGAALNNPVVYSNSSAAFFEYAQIPTNFFDYTPARFLGATQVAFVNTNTANGGPLPEGRTNDWNTLDYGWDGLMRALKPLQDVLKEVSGVHEYQEFGDEDCVFELGTSTENMKQYILSLLDFSGEFATTENRVGFRRANRTEFFSEGGSGRLENAQENFTTADYFYIVERSRSAWAFESSEVVTYFVEQSTPYMLYDYALLSENIDIVNFNTFTNEFSPWEISQSGNLSSLNEDVFNGTSYFRSDYNSYIDGVFGGITTNNFVTPGQVEWAITSCFPNDFIDENMPLFVARTFGLAVREIERSPIAIIQPNFVYDVLE